MTTRACERCGEQLRARHAHHARYCSTRCRVAAHRARPRVPAELAERDRWVRRSPAKVPLTVSGAAASSTNPATWSSLADAKASTAGAGLGFVLAGDGIVCVDLDHCLDQAGEPLEWVRPILDLLPPTWVEVGPSGDGLHIWGTADFVGGRRRPYRGHTAEVYADGRYMSITGRPFRCAPAVLADLSAVLAEVL